MTRKHLSQAKKPALTYDEAKKLAAEGDLGVRCALAAREDLPPEFLYYLAEDKEAEVRRVAAANPTLPAKAARLLAGDGDDEVRGVLAGKLASSAAAAAAADADRQIQVAHEALALLARDQAVRVRQILAEVLKDVVNADHALVAQLARDTELVVCGPILEFSPVLTDDDLIEIIQSGALDEALACISRRAYLDETVTDAIVATNNTQAITHLLRNTSAQIREATLDGLVDRATSFVQWHEPLVYRPDLKGGMAVKLAQFVASNLMAKLMERKDLDPEAARQVAQVMEQRLKAEGEKGVYSRQASADMAGSQPTRALDPVLEQVRGLHAEGRLTEPQIMAALFADDHSFVIAALAVRADLPLRAVMGIVQSHSASALVSLSWKAKLSARFSVEIQVKLGRIPPGEAIRPTRSGQYSMPPESMGWQVELFCETATDRRA